MAKARGPLWDLSAVDEANQEALEIESMAEALARRARQRTRAADRDWASPPRTHDPKLSAIVLEVRLIRLASHAGQYPDLYRIYR